MKYDFDFSDAEGDDEIEIIGEDNGMVAKGLLPYKPRLSTYPYNSDAKKEGENPVPGGLTAIPGPSSSGEFDLNYVCIDFKKTVKLNNILTLEEYLLNNLILK